MTNSRVRVLVPRRHRFPRIWTLPVSLAALLVFGAGRVAYALERTGAKSISAEAESRLPMMSDPVIEQAPPETRFDRQNIALWLSALERPEFDVRVEALEAFAEAHRQGVKDLSEVVPQIEKLLASDPNPSVRLSAARALIEFDQQSAASVLQLAIETDAHPSATLVLTVDRALAHWRHAEATPKWIARIKVASTGSAAAVSAIQSLGAVRAKQANDALVACVRDQSLSPSIRLEAAKAVAMVDGGSRVDLAAELASEPGQWGPLFATLVLGAGRDDLNAAPPESAAIPFIQSLAAHSDPRVRAHAAYLLRCADVRLVRALPELLRDPDDLVRLEATRALAGAPPSSRAALAAALNDVSEPVRVAARSALRDAANSDPAVLSSILLPALSSGNWREAEQAAILAGEIKAVSAREKLEALLDFERGEVRLASATALRILNQSASLPALVKRAEAISASSRGSVKDAVRAESEAREIAQIFTLFAQQRYRPVTDLLVTYIPKKSPYHPLPRAVAIYALGKIFESQPPPPFAMQLLERASDNNPVDPEDGEVRRFSIVALARMGARDSVPALRDVYESENSVVTSGGAARWAIMQLESTELPPCLPVMRQSGPFFLEAIRPASTADQH